MAADATGTGIQVNGIMPRGSTRMANANAMSILMGVPEETLPPIMPGMPPEQVAPAVVYLAHESVPFNGEVFAIGSGTLERVVVLETAGMTLSSDRPTPEEIAANIGTTLDIDGARVVGVGGVDTPGATPMVQPSDAALRIDRSVYGAVRAEVAGGLRHEHARGSLHG